MTGYYSILVLRGGVIKRNGKYNITNRVDPPPPPPMMTGVSKNKSGEEINSKSHLLVFKKPVIILLVSKTVTSYHPRACVE